LSQVVVVVQTLTVVEVVVEQVVFSTQLHSRYLAHKPQLLAQVVLVLLELL
jgi:hypothetical protein